MTTASFPNGSLPETFMIALPTILTSVFVAASAGDPLNDRVVDIIKSKCLACHDSQVDGKPAGEVAYLADLSKVAENLIDKSNPRLGRLWQIVADDEMP